MRMLDVLNCTNVLEIEDTDMFKDEKNKDNIDNDVVIEFKNFSGYWPKKT